MKSIPVIFINSKAKILSLNSLEIFSNTNNTSAKLFIDKKIETGSFGIGNVFNIVEVIIPNVPSDPINRFFKSNPILFFFNGFIVETI